MLVEELAGGGELFAFLKHTQQFPEKLARTFFQQLVAALAHCHEEGVTHRDLKVKWFISYNIYIIMVNMII